MPPLPATCTRMPSHFHSAAKSSSRIACHSASSSAWASISGRKMGVAAKDGRSDVCSSQPTRSVYGGLRPCQSSSMSSTDLPKASATACLARRAETPTRGAPLRNFSNAQRPVASSWSSHWVRSAAWPPRPAFERAVTISERRGPSPSAPAWGQISATVSAVSPTSSRDRRKSTGSKRESPISASTRRKGKEMGRPSLKAASAKPRSGSGVARK